MNRWILGLALLVPGLDANGAFGAEHSLTLDEAIRLALQKNEGLRIEREAVAAANEGLRQARGAYDPVLQMSAGWSRTRQPIGSSPFGVSTPLLALKDESTEAGVAIQQRLPTGGALALRASGSRATSDGAFARFSPAYDTEVGVELRQPLLRDRAIDSERLATRVAVTGRRAAGASLRRTLSETVAGVERAYWNLTAARLGVEVREAAVRLAEEQLAETRIRVEAGVVPGTELAQPRAELERRRGEMLAASERAAREENSLKLLVLADGDESLWLARIVPTDSVGVERAPADVATSMTRALATRPELDIASAVVQRRRAETAYARDGVWPSLDAVASYGRFGLSGTQLASGGTFPVGPNGGLDDSFEALGDGNFNAAQFALVLGLPFPNRSARASSEAARSVERQAEADVSRVRKAIRAEVLDAAAGLETASQRIEAARSAREAAEIQLAAESDRYETGLSTNFLVLTRQNDLSRARLDEISALTDYRLARAEMARVTGSLIEERAADAGVPRR